PSGREMWWSECPRRARAPKARAQAHKRLGTISRRAAHRAAHGSHAIGPAKPSPRPRDEGAAAGAGTRGDIRLPQRSEDRRKGGLTKDVIYDDDGANGDRDALGRITKKTEWIVEGDTPDPGGAPRPLASRTYDYGYNPEGRPWLESVAVDGTVVSSYGYDDNGNRTSADLAWSQLGYDESFDYSLTEADTVYDSA